MSKLNPITARIRKFKQDLKKREISDARIVRQYISSGTPYIFQNEEDLYFELREEIAKFFNISFSSVIMVGSSKLGFSIHPQKLWRHITEESDIDMTIVNENLFDAYWINLFEFNINLTPRSSREDKKYRDFLLYFFKGWIRPDLFPFENPKQADWFSFLQTLYNKYDNRKVTVGIFRNEYFFESYQVSNINKIREGGL